jgi:dTDP-4-dehydrorhamnose reductase
MRLLITGASGQLGGYLLRAARARGIEIIAWSGSRTGTLEGVPLRPVELADGDTIASAFVEARPTAVIHAAALASVVECHRDPERAEQVNVRASGVLAELAGRAGARLVFTSTDLVFDGARGGYREEDAAAPLSIYGRSKRAAEQVVQSMPGTAVARLSLLYGPTVVGRPSFFDEQLLALRQRRPVRLFADEWRTPLTCAAAASALLRLVESDFGGLVHIGGPVRVSVL